MSESTLTPFDAIHMVVYGVENTPDGPRPNENFMREGFYQVRAAVASLKDGQSNNVVIGGINYGTLDGSVRISQVYADNLRQNFLAEDIEGVNVFAEAEQLSPDQIESGAKETGGEVDFVLAQARLRGWRKILCISDDIHEKRVRMLYRSRGAQALEDYNVSIPTGKIGVKFDSALGILRTKDTEVFRQFLDREWMDTSRILSREMEFAKRAVMLVDPKGQFFTWLAGRLSHEAKYKLNTANG